MKWQFSSLFAFLHHSILQQMRYKWKAILTSDGYVTIRFALLNSLKHFLWTGHKPLSGSLHKGYSVLIFMNT
jgi:hypothetical protein